MNYKKIILKTLLAPALSLLIGSMETVAYAQETTIKPIDLKQIQTLIDKGDSSQAYSLLAPHLDELAGEAEFDYLYGLASSDQKKYALSIMAFQRVLAFEPNFVGARLELAIAHFELDELLISKNEFLEVLDKNPPEQTKTIIIKYLALIDGIEEDAKEKPWTVSVGISLGNDDNVNSATSAMSYLGFDLSENSIQTESPFNELFSRGTYKHKLSKENSFYVAANIKSRSNADATFANTDSNTISLGAQHLFDKSVLSYGLIFNNNNLDGEANTSLTGISTSLYDEDENGNNNVIHFRYADIDNKLNDIQDIEQVIGGLSKNYNFDRKKLSLAFIFGADSPKQTGSPYGKIILGTRIGFANKASEQLTLAANAGIVSSTYTGEFNDQDRSDIAISFGMTANYQIDKHWAVSAAFNTIDNQSDIDLYTYDKTSFFAKATWSY
jgi:tetratricopeptide (TPR) repeat protein